MYASSKTNFLDILQLLGEGLLHTPSTGRQQIVMKFLTEDRNQKHLPNPSNEDKPEGNLMEFSKVGC